MTRVWLRTVATEKDLPPDERRIREFLASPGGVSESALSLSAKLDIGQRRCRAILDRLVEQGMVDRRELDGMAPMYTRFPTR